MSRIHKGKLAVAHYATTYDETNSDTLYAVLKNDVGLHYPANVHRCQGELTKLSIQATEELTENRSTGSVRGWGLNYSTW
jgi:hypothetical protein